MLSWTFCTETPNKIEKKAEQTERRNHGHHKAKEGVLYGLCKSSVRKWSNISAEKIQKSSKMQKAEVRAVEITPNTISVLSKEAKESFEISLALSMKKIQHSTAKVSRKRITIQDLIN